MAGSQKLRTQADTPPTPTKVFKCGTCYKTTLNSRQALEQHRRSAHVPAQCSVCKRSFFDMKSLKQHKNMHKQCSGGLQEAQMQSVTPPKAPVVESVPQPSSSSLQFPSVVEDIIFPGNGINVGAPGIPLAAPRIIYKDHGFTVFHPLEQQLMLKYLSARCHSSQRLRKQGYFTAATSKILGGTYPNRSSIKRTDFRESPQSTPISSKSIRSKRQAVTLDCEMVQVERGQSELTFISVVDFLTGEVLINNYVQPQLKVTNWKSEISGVTASAVNAAVAGGQAFRGWSAARQALWEHIGSDTILIGHSLNNDLSVLGIYHSKVFDSAIFTAEMVFPECIRPTEGIKRLWSLKTLARDFLSGLDIQSSKNGHDCLGDTMTTREVVLFCLGNPEALKLWAEETRRQYDNDQMKNKNNKGKKPVKESSYSSMSNLTKSDTDHDTEFHRWEDITGLWEASSRHWL